MKIYKIKVNGKSYRVELEAIEQVDTAPLEEKKKQDDRKPLVNSGNGAKEVVSPIQGQVTNIKVKVGDKVQKGDVLLIIEAMKLENEVVSPFEGEVKEILVNKGQNVKAKEPIVIIE
jgi:biotin carboxyl carrier protein